MTGAIIVIFGVVVLFLVIVAAYLFSSSPAPTPAPQDGKAPAPQDGNVLTITEKGASTTETYRMREGYMIIPDVGHCHNSPKPPGWCREMGYSKDEGMAFIYDVQLGPRPENNLPCDGETLCEDKPNTCPGGGYDCAFTEKYDSEGTLISISNKNGEELLEKMADDAWAGKWENWNFAQTIKKDIEYKGGKLIFTKDIHGPDVPGGEIKAGDELTLKLATSMGVPTIYFIALLLLMSESGEPKPDKIVLAVKGARDSFRLRIKGTEGNQ
jgi:hypothetical protein